jgi:hypothetical protein
MMKRFFFFWAAVICVSIVATEPVRSESEIAAEKTLEETPTGPQIFGVFRGRTPCQELSALLNASASEACNKIKCRLFLYQDPITKTPTTYEWAGKIKWTGKWTIVKGSKTDANAILYRLETPDPKAYLCLRKADENILLILNRNESPLVGNEHFSYTLNRMVKK